MYFLVCLLILVIIVKVLNVKETFNVKESFNNACVTIFEPYLNSLINKEDIKDLYDRKIGKQKGGQFKAFIEARIKNDKKDYNKKVGYFQYLHNIDIDEYPVDPETNPDAHTENCFTALENI